MPVLKRKARGFHAKVRGWNLRRDSSFFGDGVPTALPALAVASESVAQTRHPKRFQLRAISPGWPKKANRRWFRVHRGLLDYL
jgi:hypothetical protein